MEAVLDKKNKKIVQKMYRYIETFPLKDYEIEQMKEDITGMALEAEQRDETLGAVLGKKPRDFCDDILYSIGGIKTPGGRKLLRIAAAYYQILGFCFIFITALSMFLDIYSALSVEVSPELLFGCFAYNSLSLIAGAFYYAAGSHALIYSNNSTKAKAALNWGFAIIIFNILYVVIDSLSSLYLPTVTETTDFTKIFGAFPTWFTILIRILFVIIDFVFPAIYLLGAYRNRRHPEDTL